MGFSTHFFILNFYSGSRIIMRSRVELPVFVSGPRTSARARISIIFQYTHFFTEKANIVSAGKFSHKC